jgi:hypothetical protein
MSPSDAERVEQLIRAGDPDGVAAALAGASPDERRATVPVVKRLLTGHHWWESGTGQSGANAMLVAGAACLPTAKQVAGWLCRADFRFVEQRSELIVDVLRARRLPWLGDLAVLLAEAANRDREPSRWRVAAALVLETGIPIPTTDEFVLGWAADRFGWASRRSGAADRFGWRRGGDPFLLTLVPLLFEVDGAGPLLDVAAWERSQSGFDPANAPVRVLAGLAADGLLDRAMLLDGCLSRFLKGERPAALRAFVELHATLAPTVDELAARSADYARLLPDAHSTVAALAQAALRTLDAAGCLDRATLLRAGRDVLFRSEKGLVKAQLTGLDKAATRDPSRAAEVVEVVAVAFAHPALDLQERALTIVERHLEACGPATRATLAAAASSLGADLSARAAALGLVVPNGLGLREEHGPDVREVPAGVEGVLDEHGPDLREVPTSVGGASTGVPVGIGGASTGVPTSVGGASTGVPVGVGGASTGVGGVSVGVGEVVDEVGATDRAGVGAVGSGGANLAASRPMPPPIASAPEFAAELSAILSGAADPVAWERVLDGLVRLAFTDRAALRDSLTPVLDRAAPRFEQPDRGPLGLETLLCQAVAVVVGRNTGSLWRGFAEAMPTLTGGPEHEPARRAIRGLPAPHLLLHWRLNELGNRIDRRPVPHLLSTPTTTTGHVDPQVLISRVAAAEAEGWQPWPADLAQALLRLPRPTSTTTPDAATTGTPATAGTATTGTPATAGTATTGASTADPATAGPAANAVTAGAVPDAARALTSAAGRALAGWLATGGPADPVAELVRWRSQPRAWSGPRHESMPANYPIVGLTQVDVPQDPVVARILRHDAGQFTSWNYTFSQPLWPALLPSHREVVAASLLPEAAHGSPLAYGPLPALAECAGPCGPAMWLLLGNAFGAARDEHRIAAVDAALTLDAAGDLDGEAFGTALATLVAGHNVKLSRVTATLTSLADAGVTQATWTTVSVLLAGVLPTPKPPAGTPDLLALGSRLAATRHAKPRSAPSIVGLADVAARKGSSRLATEARRLQGLLA